MSSSELRVAISGGGIAGAALMHTLVKNFPSVSAHIFESATSFREEGIAIGITRNAQLALSMMSSLGVLDGSGAVPVKGVHFTVEQGPDAGKSVFDLDVETAGNTSITSIVQRGQILREFFANVPSSRMHTQKKLLRVDGVEQEGPLTLYFEDGTTHETDVLVGADGIHSRVRRLILGDDDPAIHPVNSGSWALLTLQDYAKAREALPNVDIANAREFAGAGYGGCALYNVLSRGSKVQFTLCGWDKTDDNSTEWQKPLTREYLRARFVEQDWGRLSKAVDQLICSDPDVPEWTGVYLWYHLHARTYCKGQLCMVGDAAHAMTPYQASGAATSIEDACILSNLLGRARNVGEARAALQSYDQIRRPRTQKISDSSYVTGQMMSGISEFGLDAERLSHALKHRWDFIVDVDLQKDLDDAKANMDSCIAKTTR